MARSRYRLVWMDSGNPPSVPPAKKEETTLSYSSAENRAKGLILRNGVESVLVTEEERGKYGNYHATGSHVFTARDFRRR